ncbi:unnamed protein product [Ectocarpus fasciculatus]
MAGVLGLFFGTGEVTKDDMTAPAGKDQQASPVYVASIDQGTSSSRCIVFGRDGSIVAEHQMEHEQFYPRPGCVEHDAEEIWRNVEMCVKSALNTACLGAPDMAAVGITNQRESTLVWDRNTGTPLHPLIVWNDVRTESICRDLKADGGADRFRGRTGLPISPYFSATKLMWLLDNVAGLRELAEKGDALFGTMDSWLMWKLTGGRMHVTDVTNASRTNLMSLEGLHWDKSILQELGIPACMLPSIVSSSEVYCVADNPDNVLNGVRVAGILGDQQAALFGQTCFREGQTKCTYGTGSFILMNTGERVVPSTNGLLSTVGFKLGEQACVYALEGSIAYAGSTVQWLRDNLEMIKSASEIEALARTVEDNGGVFFVPAFAGLLAPHWRGDARGLMCGLTAYNTKAHVVRAVLESTAFQVQEVLGAMNQDSGVEAVSLKVDGGMTANTLLMQFQADLLGVQVLRPKMSETTALGAAFAAGLAVGVWEDIDDLSKTWALGQEYEATMAAEKRDTLLRNWQRAVKRSLGWEVTEGYPMEDEGGGKVASAVATRSGTTASGGSWRLETAALMAIAAAAGAAAAAVVMTTKGGQKLNIGALRPW